MRALWGSKRAGLRVVVAVVLFVSSSNLRAQCTGCREPSFAGPRFYPWSVGTFFVGPALAIGDIDGDGRDDLVTYDSTVGGFAVSLGDGLGHFGAPVYTLTGGVGYNGLVVGDFDHDGHVDVLAIESQSSAVHFFHGTGSTTLGPPAILPIIAGPYLLVTGDFDGDGNLDFASANNFGNVSISLGAGDGTFPRGATVPVGTGPYSLLAKDMTGDGRDELVAVTPGGTVAVILGSASGNFAPASVYPFSGTLQTAALGDWNGDGVADLSILVQGSVVLMAGTSSGSFVDFGSFATPFNTAGSVAIGDFSGSSDADILVISDTLQIYTGDGAGLFALDRRAPGYGSPAKVITADLNRDGRPDVLFGIPGRVIVISSTTAGGLDLPRSSATTPFSSGLGVGDFDGDGRSDLAAWNGSAIQIYLGSASGDLVTGPSVPYSASGSPVGPFGADVDGDGKADLYLFDFDNLVIFRNLGAASFAPPVSITLGTSPGPVLFADLDKDGLPDLLVLSFSQGSLSVYLGTGGANFQFHGAVAVGFQPLALTSADFDGDGNPDVAVAAGPTGFFILRGNGAGGFLTIQSVPAPTTVFSIVAEDFDGDSHPDVAALQYAPSGAVQLTVYRNTGSGSFTTTDYPLFGLNQNQRGSLRTADFNVDGRPDLVILPPFIGDIAVLMNDGLGHFGPPRTEIIGAQLAEPGDFDGDRLPDIGFRPYLVVPAVAVVYNTSCRPRHLGLSVEVPSCVPVGSPFAPQPQVQAFDDGGNVVACAAGSVTAILAAGSPPGVLGGTLVVPFASGTAAFTDLSVSPAGTGYRVQFDAPAGRVLSRQLTAGSAAPTITGPAVFCASVGTTYDAGSGFESYEWTLDGVIVGSGRMLSTGPVTVGAHSLMVTVRSGECVGSDSRSVTASDVPDTSLSRPPIVCGGSSGNVASVPDSGPGAVYVWSIGNGTIDSGAGTPSITFTAGPSGTVSLTATVTANGCQQSTNTNVPINAHCGSFFALTPCRIIDTRGGPALGAGSAREFVVAGSCGILQTARTVVLNIAVTGSSADGNLVMFKSGTPPPNTSTINYHAGRTRSNNAIIDLAPPGSFVVFCSQPSGTVDLIVDVTGYFE